MPMLRDEIKADGKGFNWTTVHKKASVFVR